MYEKISEIEGFLETNYRMHVEHNYDSENCIVQFYYQKCVVTLSQIEIAYESPLQLAERIASYFETLMKGEALND